MDCRDTFKLADMVREHGDYKRAAYLYEKAKEKALAEGLKKEAVSCDFALADLDYVRGNHEKAKERIEELEKGSAQTFGVNYEAARLLGHIALAQGDLKAAREYYCAALVKAEEMNSQYQMIESNNSLAEAQESYVDAVKYLDKAREISVENRTAPLEYGKSFCIEADLRIKDMDYSLAEEAADKAIVLLEEVGYAGGVAHAYVSRGKARYFQEKYELAFGDFDNALRHYEETDTRPNFRFEATYYIIKSEIALGKSFSDIEMTDANEYFSCGSYPYLKKEFEDYTKLVAVE